MDYPSLLFTKGSSGNIIADDVFEDVKLNLFFSEEAVEAMQNTCPASDIPVRQAFFQAFLEDEEVRPRFEAMAGMVDEIWRLSDAWDKARVGGEKNFIYLNLISRVLEFYTMAAKPPLRDSCFWTRFYTAFQDAIQSPQFQAVATQCRELLTLVAPICTNCWKISGDNLALLPEDGPTLTDTLLTCAQELGLSDIDGTRATSIRLAPALVQALESLYPEAFSALETFAGTYGRYYDDRILNYRSELNFYIEAAGLFSRLKTAGLPITWPKLSARRRIWIKNALDISLLAKNEVTIVPNDVDFNEEEPFWFLTGANGGGKTTYLRCVGINVLLFLSGCPVAGRAAEIWPVATIFTHFPKDERSDSEGRLSEEQERVDEILANHGGNSLVLLNETYSAANAEQAPQFTIDLAAALADGGSFGLYITHQHAVGETRIPFLSVVIDEDSENRRTFKIERRRGVARSFAEDILKKYGMDRASLQNRFVRLGGKTS